jgi:copper oxidase (laccase) domain-containing protein
VAELPPARSRRRLQLLSAGLPAEQIDTSDRCTHRDADEFFSHRRDNGITGRRAANISPAA